MRFARLAAFALLLAVVAPAHADHLELGIGATLLSYPDYRGSDHQNRRLLPLPYVVYYDEHVRVNRSGVRVDLLHRDDVSLSLSAAFSLAANDSDARDGMPHLLPTFEIGPSVDWRFADVGDGIWRLRVPIRAVCATNLREFHSIGWFSSPNVETLHWTVLDDWGLVWSASAGPLFATRPYHAYFYDVRARDATAERPEFHAQGGYSGARATAFVGARHGPWRLGFLLLDDWLRHSRFDDSPLVQRENALVAGLGFSYVFYSRGGSGADPEADTERD